MSWVYLKELISDWPYGGAPIFSGDHQRYWSKKIPINGNIPMDRNTKVHVFCSSGLFVIKTRK